jgi:hypothetical protein
MPAKKTARKKAPKGRVRFTQIVTAPFTTSTGSSYSVLGVSREGRVYRFDPKCDAWIPWSDKIATCKADHKAGR